MNKHIQACRDILSHKVIPNPANIMSRLENHFKKNPVKPVYVHPYKEWRAQA